MDEEKPSMEDTMGQVFDRLQAEEREAKASAPVESAPTQETETPEAEGPAEPPAPDGRARDEDGKFTKAPKEKPKAAAKTEPAQKPAGKAVEAKAAPEAEKPKEGAESAPTPEKTAPAGFQPPGGWSAAAKATWATLPPAAQAAIAQREKEVSDGFARYEGIGRALAPMRATLQARRVSDADYIGQMVQIDAALSNPQTRAQAFDYLFRSYGYQPPMAGADPNAAGRQPQQQLSEDPTVATLQQQLAAVTQHIRQEQAQRAQQEQMFQAETQRQASTDVEKFRNDPKNEFFDTVRDDMRAIYERATQAGQPLPTLSEAYEAAIWANPQTRPILVGREIQKQADAKAKEAAAAAANARKAAGPGVRGTSSASVTPSARPKKTMEEEMREIYDSMNGS